MKALLEEETEKIPIEEEIENQVIIKFSWASHVIPTALVVLLVWVHDSGQ